MNNLINLNSEVSSYDLRRIIHYWGYEENSYTYYVLAPHWVHLWVNDIVNMHFDKSLKEGDDSENSMISDKDLLKKKMMYQIAEEKKITLYSKDIDIPG